MRQIDDDGINSDSDDDDIHEHGITASLNDRDSSEEDSQTMRN
jgi:hypothetical protein